MNTSILKSCVVVALASVAFSVALAEETDPIKDAMKYAHKAPKGEKKICEKIVEGTASDEETKKTLDLYKAMAGCKPAKGEADAFKAKVAKLITATEDVFAKKPNAAATYKEAVNCKACHSEHKPD